MNGTEAQLVDVNAGGVDVDALTFKDNVTLTNTELAALASTSGVYVTSNLNGVADAVQLKRVMGMASQYPST